MSRPDLSAAEQVLHNLTQKAGRKEVSQDAERPRAPKAEAKPLPKAKSKAPAQPSGFKHTRTSPRGK